MLLLAQCFYSIQGEVLLGKEVHELTWNGINFFSLEYSPGIAETGLDIFKTETRAIMQDFISAPALSKEVNNEFNCEANIPNNGLTNQNIWVEGNASLLIHKQTGSRPYFSFHGQVQFSQLPISLPT